MPEISRPEPIEVEPNFNKFVIESGGQLVSTLISKDSNSENADYYFSYSDVIAELKCLQKDLFNADEDILRIFEYLKQWKEKNLIEEGDEIKIILGRKKLPAECSRNLMNAASKTIDRLIHKANRQISETKKQLDKRNAKGLLLICNDGNYFLQNDTYVALIANMMTRKYLKSEIDGFVFFTWNQVVTLPNSNLDHTFWIPSYRKENDHILGDFVNDLGAKFNDYYTKVTGIPPTQTIITADFDEGMKLIQGMKYLPKEIAYGSKNKK